jgi:hypothetical protein
MKFRFIFTASIIEPEREQIYVDAIRDTMSKISGIPIIFYVVENNGIRPTLLDTIGNINIVYTDSNKETWGIGKKELYDIKYVCEKYNFSEDDIIVKMTGRYLIKQPSIIDKIMDFQETCDVFIKFYDVNIPIPRYYDCILGLYAIRYSILKHIPLEQFDTGVPEIVFATYIRNTVKPERIMEIKLLDMYFRGQKDFLV